MRIILAFFILAVSGCVSSPTDAPGLPARPVFQSERLSIAEDKTHHVDGTWRSRGYGWVLEIENGVITQYESGVHGCYARPEGAAGQTAMLSLPFSHYKVTGDGQSAMFMYGPDSVGPIFDRLVALPNDCLNPTDGSLEASFAVFISMFEEHYAHFNDRGADWLQLKGQALEIFNNNKTEEGFLDAADHILSALQDSHTRLIAFTADGRRRVQYGLGQALSNIRNENRETEWLIGLIVQLTDRLLDPGAQHVAEDRILWGLIDGEIGYLQVFQMGGFAGLEIDDPEWAASELRIMDKTLDEAFAEFSGKKAVILDLSNNRGGYDEIARRLAARFTDTSFHAYSVSAKGENLQPVIKVIEPERDNRFIGPVFLLTSDVTVSGGEIATLSLRQLPNVTQIGQPTRGAFSTPLSKVLPNGWILELANETFASPDGEVFAGRGIPPQVSFVVFDAEDPVASHGDAIEAIIHLIRETDETTTR
jgi:carboxyl-terminal processing protease